VRSRQKGGGKRARRGVARRGMGINGRGTQQAKRMAAKTRVPFHEMRNPNGAGNQYAFTYVAEAAYCPRIEC